ncbi:hypothetical protein EV421DRAFT_1997021 [Armillaria borealis]|uniref:Uncharacterized protein n=1 Tax=Armillaria borealis TaxID=47425 RepID=A0AA39MH36_9AGAR|nr:hypothetical protein EV421DRAFT_1997021 [Armillaria borealis]
MAEGCACGMGYVERCAREGEDGDGRSQKWLSCRKEVVLWLWGRSVVSVLAGSAVMGGCRSTGQKPSSSPNFETLLSKELPSDMSVPAPPNTPSSTTLGLIRSPISLSRARFRKLALPFQRIQGNESHDHAPETTPSVASFLRSIFTTLLPFCLPTDFHNQFNFYLAHSLQILACHGRIGRSQSIEAEQINELWPFFWEILKRIGDDFGKRMKVKAQGVIEHARQKDEALNVQLQSKMPKGVVQSVASDPDIQNPKFDAPYA